MAEMMKCAIYNGIGNVSVEERPIPDVGNKDVLVKVLRAGICGSDVGIFTHGGENYGVFPGSQFGHEMVGKVTKKGPMEYFCYTQNLQTFFSFKLYDNNI